MSIGNLVPVGGTIIGGAAAAGIVGASLYGVNRFVDTVSSDKKDDHASVKISVAGIASTALGITTFTTGSAIQNALTVPRAANGRPCVWYSFRDLKPMSNGAKAGTQLLKTAGGVAATAGLILTVGATVMMESGKSQARAH